MALKAIFSILESGLTAFLLLAPCARAADSRPVVAVFDVQTKFLKLPRAKLDMLTELLGQELGVGGVFQIMPPGDVKKALLEQSAESFKACYEEKCQIALGRQLPANKLVTTTIMKAAGRCRVAASLYDLRRQTTDIVAMNKCACSEAGLVPAVERVAAKLRDYQSSDGSGVFVRKSPVAARFAEAERLVRDFEKVKLSSDVKTFHKNLTKKLSRLNEVHKAFTAVFKMAAAAGQSEYAVASLVRLGQAYRAMLVALRDIAPPAELTGEQRTIFKADLKKMLAPIAEVAAENFRKAIEQAGKLSYEGKWSDLAREQLAIMGRDSKPGKGAGAAVEWVHSKPAGVDFTKSEITVAQYRACVQAGKCTPPRAGTKEEPSNWEHPGRDNHPVNCVDWNQVNAFCAWVGGRLPTDSEWYAEASNGGKRTYPWGNEQVSCERAVWSQGGSGCGSDTTWPVCSKPKGNSASGLCDMSGNVLERTTSSDGSDRAVLGGAYYFDDPKELRADWAGRADADWSSGYGFRCVRAAAP